MRSCVSGDEVADAGPRSVVDANAPQKLEYPELTPRGDQHHSISCGNLLMNCKGRGVVSCIARLELQGRTTPASLKRRPHLGGE